jgi:hypothetical protein
MPAFVSLEQETSEQTQLAQAKLQQEESAVAHDSEAEHSADHKHNRRAAHRDARRSAHDRHAPAKREAEHHPRAARAKSKSA